MKDATDITIILDRTGSMEIIRNDTIGGFNSFLNDQKKVPGECTLTVAQFDSQNPFEIIYNHVSIKDAQPLSSETYIPRASTPLLDAIGHGINATGARLSALQESERPDKVIFVIITDGLENASKEFKKATIKQMIERQHDVYKWEFVFLGANMNAIQEGGSIGIPSSNSMTFAANALGTQDTYKSVSRTTSQYRVGEVLTMAFSQEDRDKQDQALLKSKTWNVSSTSEK